MQQADHGERVSASRTDVTFPAYSAATTAFVVWLLNRLAFRSDDGSAIMPVEVYAWVQLTVPMAMAKGAAEWRLRRARRRPRSLPEADAG